MVDTREGETHPGLTGTRAGPVIYRLCPVDPGAQRLQLTIRVPDPDPEGETVSLPAWTPGSYLVRDFARHVLSIRASTQESPLAIRKLDKSTWAISPTDQEITVEAEIFAGDLSVRGAYLDTEFGFINGTSVFFRVHGRESATHRVHLLPPPGPDASAWQVATSLERLAGNPREFGSFQASDWESLVDQPLLMGALRWVDFDVAGVPHSLSVAGRAGFDADRLREDLSRICAAQVAMFGEPPPMDRYVFLLMTLNKGYGGLEHRWSSALISREQDLPGPETLPTDARYRRFLGLVSHEYFHLWNVKRIRADELAKSRLDQEAYTRQLWIFEGITSYYDDLMLLRSGVIDIDSYLELLGRTLTAVYRSRGRRRQTLEESSFDAWIKFYRRDANTPNAVVSYYSKGAMVALALDLELRHRTDGRICLDDVMRALWKTYGEQEGRHLHEGAFEALTEELSGLDLKSFFNQSLRSTTDPPVGILLARFGVSLHLRETLPGEDRGGKPAPVSRPENPCWLGVRLEAGKSDAIVASVLDDGPARNIGLIAGDHLIAVDDRRVDRQSLGQLLEHAEPGSRINLTFFRRDELRQASVILQSVPQDTCYLTLQSDPDNEVLQRRRQWLGE